MSIQDGHIKSPRVSITASHEIIVTDYDSDNSDHENNNVHEEKKKEKLNLWKFIKTMKIEPVAFCFSFVSMSRFLAMQQMLQDKICVQKFGQSFDYCRKLSGAANSALKNNILSETSTYTFYYTTIMVVPGLFWCIFVGSWCDKYLGAKRLFIILCAVSGFIEAVFLIVNAYFFFLDPMYTLLGLIPAYAVGVHYSGYTAIYSYLAANTDKKMRAVRFGTVEVCANVASPVGQIIGGRLLAMTPFLGNGQVFNYIGVYAIEIPAFLFVIVWALFMIKEKGDGLNVSKQRRTLTSSSIQSSNNNNNNYKEIATETSGLIEREDKLRLPTLSDVFSLQDLKSVWITVTKKRDNHVRLIFWSIFVAHLLTCLPLWGFSYVSLPLVERLYFWDSTQLADARVIGTVLKPFMTMIFVPILTQKLNFNDMQLGIIGSISCICFTTFVASILTPTGFYLSFFLGSFSTLSVMAVRSFVSKLLPKNEVSKAVSVIIMLESLMTVLASTFMVSIFNASISFYPTLCYHIASLLLIVAMVIFMVIDLKTMNKS